MQQQRSESIPGRISKTFLRTWQAWTRPLFASDSMTVYRRVELLSSLLLVFLILLILGLVIGLLAGYQENRQYFAILFGSWFIVVPLYFLSRTKLYPVIITAALIFMFAFPFYAIVARQDFSSDRLRSVLGWLVAAYLLGISLLSMRANIGLVLLSFAGTLLLPVFTPEITLRTVIPGLGFLLAAAFLIIANVRYRDVIENDRMNAIHEVQDTYRAVVEHSLQGLAIYQNGRIVFANSAYANILGYSPEELLRFTPDQVMGPIHPDDRIVMQTYRTGSTELPGGSVVSELRVIRKDGSLCWVETAVTAIQYRGAPALQAATMDITERRRAAQVQASIYKIAEAAQTTQDLNAFYEAVHGIICDLMQARNFYIALYDTASDLFNIAYRRDDFDKADEWITYKPGRGLGSYILRTGKPLLITPEKFAQLERDGEVEVIARRMVDYLGAPLITSRGIIGVMAVQTYNQEERLTEADRDVLAIVSTQVATAIERKQARMEREQIIRDLEVKNAELERFTYTVSHDLRSPIITIRGFLGYLEKAAVSGNMEQFKSDMTRIVNATNKMDDLLNDLLELSRIGRIVNPPRRIHFNEIVNEALTMVGGQILANHSSVEIQVGMPMVHGDKTRLVEVMQNLLENAIKFSGPQPPVIEIGHSGSDGEGRNIFFVRDHGMGIAPEHHERIFGLFNKLNPRTDGTGIGLALVKRIIEVEDGRIWVESEGEGKGATFYFALPSAGP